MSWTHRFHHWPWRPLFIKRPLLWRFAELKNWVEPPSAPLTELPKLVNVPLPAVEVSLKNVWPLEAPPTAAGLFVKEAAAGVRAIEELCRSADRPVHCATVIGEGAGARRRGFMELRLSAHRAADGPGVVSEGRISRGGGVEELRGAAGLQLDHAAIAHPEGGGFSLRIDDGARESKRYAADGGSPHW